jgi:hypothetical protein
VWHGCMCMQLLLPGLFGAVCRGILWGDLCVLHPGGCSLVSSVMVIGALDSARHWHWQPVGPDLQNEHGCLVFDLPGGLGGSCHPLVTAEGWWGLERALMVLHSVAWHAFFYSGCTWLHEHSHHACTHAI